MRAGERTGPADGARSAVSRRRALAGFGLGGALIAGSLGAPAAAQADEAPAIQGVTIAGLRGTITPTADVVYYVTDPGQEGPFRYDPDDTTTADDTGVVLVSSGGHRFKRAFTGPIQISWFGATADYDTQTDTGTPADDALTKALASLKMFTPSKPGFRNGFPTIAFDAGNYLFTQKNFHPGWYTALEGLHFRGEGMYQTNLFFRCPESENGTDNFFLDNDGTATSNRGVVNGFTMDGISFHGVTGTERFMFYGDTPGGGTAKRMFFVAPR